MPQLNDIENMQAILVIFVAGFTFKNSERDPAELTELMYNTKMSTYSPYTARDLCLACQMETSFDRSQGSSHRCSTHT